MVLLKLKIILTEKQHKLCEIMNDLLQLNCYCAFMVLRHCEVSYVVHKHFSGSYFFHLWCFQMLCCFINLKDHSVNCDVVIHFYKIPTFLIQRYKFLKVHVGIKNNDLTNIKFGYVLIVMYFILCCILRVAFF
jgi:hypothetical protein